MDTGQEKAPGSNEVLLGGTDLIKTEGQVLDTPNHKDLKSEMQPQTPLEVVLTLLTIIRRQFRQVHDKNAQIDLVTDYIEDVLDQDREGYGELPY